MKRQGRNGNEHSLATMTQFESIRIPVVCFIGASKSAIDSPLDEWREIRPIQGARPSDRYCAARICGESLVDENIMPGDYAVLKLNFEQYEIKPGRLVAVQTPFGLLIKRVYLTLDGKIRLVSANASYQDILLDAAEVEVRGIVTRIERDIH